MTGQGWEFTQTTIEKASAAPGKTINL